MTRACAFFLFGFLCAVALSSRAIADDVPGQAGAEGGDLAEAVRSGQYEQVRGLLDQGSNANALDDLGWPLLMVAAQAGRADIVELLVNKGADVNAKRS